jgi:lipopolysaccharide export system protein LptC
VADRRALGTGLLLVVVAAGSWWLKESLEEPHERRPRPPHTPDYWLQDLSARTTDETGQVRRHLEAESLRHYPDDDSTELTAPELVLFEPSRPPWRIRSAEGWVSPDGELVLLRGDVRIDREAAEGVPPVHLETRDLRVQPKAEYAETDAPVTARSGPHRVEAVGLRAWLGPPVRIKLLADVRGHYQVKPSP